MTCRWFVYNKCLAMNTILNLEWDFVPDNIHNKAQNNNPYFIFFYDLTFNVLIEASVRLHFRIVYFYFIFTAFRFSNIVCSCVCLNHKINANKSFLWGIDWVVVFLFIFFCSSFMFQFGWVEEINWISLCERIL